MISNREWLYPRSFRDFRWSKIIVRLALTLFQQRRRRKFIWVILCHKYWKNPSHICENDLRKRGVLRGPWSEPAINLIIINEYTRMPDHNVHGRIFFTTVLLQRNIHHLETSVSHLISQWFLLSHKLIKGKWVDHSEWYYCFYLWNHDLNSS